MNSSVVSRLPSTLPLRDDCWSQDATFTLIDAWGERYLEFNRRNLRQKQWQQVSAAVNFRHGHSRKSRRTDIQCKNRIDTLKKKYKVEKARVLESEGSYVSPWPFFSPLDHLIGNKYRTSTRASVRNRKISPPAETTSRWSLFSQVPVGPRSGTKKRRPTHELMSFGESSKEDEIRDSMDSDNSGLKSKPRFMERELGFRQLAQAIGAIGDVYERVEVAKQRHMVELEMQRMQFTKDLEYQRMQLLMEMHLQIRKIKRSRGASGAGVPANLRPPRLISPDNGETFRYLVLGKL